MDYRESLFNARSIDSTVEYNNSVSNIYQTRSHISKRPFDRCASRSQKMFNVAYYGRKLRKLARMPGK